MTAYRACDILVIGGGPAGSTAAYILASKGYNVILADKRHFPRPKLCAGLLTWKTLDLIQATFDLTVTDLYAQRLVFNKTRDYRIYRLTSEIARGRLNYPFHFIDRGSYDHFWLQKASEAGAQIITGIKVETVEPDTGCAVLSDGSLIRAKSVIGADGVWSVARRALFNGTRCKHQWDDNLAMTMESWVAHADWEPARNFAALYFGFVPWGYAWSFPRSGHQIIGIAALHRRSDHPLGAGFDRFLDSIGVDRKDLQATKGYPLPMGNFTDLPAAKRVLLVGDACGLADPLLGEGIYYAHRSAQIAARCILETGPGCGNLSSVYRSALDRHVLRELRWIRNIRNLLFVGGRRRKFRGLKFVLKIMPKRVEAAIQGQTSFSALLLPGSRPRESNSCSTSSTHP